MHDFFILFTNIKKIIINILKSFTRFLKLYFIIKLKKAYLFLLFLIIFFGFFPIRQIDKKVKILKIHFF